MRITKDNLVCLMREAFDCGQYGSYELKEQYVEEIILSLKQEAKQEIPLISLAYLRVLPMHCIIYHSLFGKGTIQLKDGERFVQFDGFRMELEEEGWPWDQEIKI